jgi:hypothetical protein
MKRLGLFITLLLVVGTSAGAHDGAISLYADKDLNSCSMDVIPPTAGGSGTGDVWMLYVKDQGVEMGAAAEFRILCTSATVFFFAPAWEPYITLINATIPGNVSIAGTTQFGCGMDIVPLGSFTVYNASDPDTFYIKVVDNPDSFAGPGIYITACDPDNTEVKVIGGTFVLTGDPDLFPANCNPGVEAKSWGAIKDMYK